MKKISTIILVLVTGLCMLTAAAEPVLTYSGSSDSAFSSTSVRTSAIGGSGIAASSRMDSFFQNPAALAEKRFGMSLPSLAVTLYNVKDLLSDPTDAQIIADAMKGQITEESGVQLAQDMLENLGSGTNELLTTDVGLGFSAGNIGFGLQVQEKLHTVADGSSNVANVNLIPEVNVGATLALGFRVIDTDAINLDIGASGQFIYKAYTKKINGSDVLAMVQDTSQVANTLLWNTPTMAGWAIPINAGVTVGFFGNSLRISAVANDINSVYHMKSFTSAGDAVNSIKEVIDVPEGHTANESTDFEIKNDMTLTLGMAWVPQVAILHPVITADLVDMMDLMTGKEEFEWSKLLLHINAGAEINLLKCIILRAGVNRGYLGVGAGLVLPGVGIEASYAWQEFGVEMGDKPVDALTIRVNIGYDKI